MREPNANLAINKLLKEVKEGFDADSVTKQLLEIRELGRAESDPTVVKICRLATEYIESEGHFNLGYVEEEEIGDMSDMEYLLELMLKIDKTANREEIQEIRDRIKDAIY